MLTIQQAAFEVLMEAGEPLKSLEIARRILAKNLVQSEAKNPVQSISQALERNIRMDKGNLPRLQFVETYMGRQIEIAEMPTTHLKQDIAKYEPIKQLPKEEITINLSKSILDKAKIFQLATGAKTLDEAIEALLKSGLASKSEHLIESIKREMEQL
jgi:hypothetical protein